MINVESNGRLCNSETNIRLNYGKWSFIWINHESNERKNILLEITEAIYLFFTQIMVQISHDVTGTGVIVECMHSII